MIKEKISSLGYFSRKGMCWIENNVCNIPLNDGSIAICDEDRFEEVNKYSWYIGGAVEGNRYPRTRINKKATEMHRYLYPDRPIDKEIDHINGNRFDNRSCNLRFCLKRENVFNQKIRKNNTSKYKGVNIKKGYINKKFVARISNIVDGKYTRINLGYFKTAEEAARAYDVKAKELHGEFARLNFPSE